MEMASFCVWRSMKMAATEGKRKTRKNKRFLGGLSRSMVSRVSFVSSLVFLYYFYSLRHCHTKKHNPQFFFVSEAVDIVFAALSQQISFDTSSIFALF